jgi:hypothetical protein
VKAANSSQHSRTGFLQCWGRQGDPSPPLPRTPIPAQTKINFYSKETLKALPDCSLPSGSSCAGIKLLFRARAVLE